MKDRRKERPESKVLSDTVLDFLSFAIQFEVPLSNNFTRALPSGANEPHETAAQQKNRRWLRHGRCNRRSSIHLYFRQIGPMTASILQYSNVPRVDRSTKENIVIVINRIIKKIA